MLVATRVGVYREQVPFALHLVSDEPSWASLHASLIAESVRECENHDTLDLSTRGRAEQRSSILPPIVRVSKADRDQVGLAVFCVVLVRERSLSGDTDGRYCG